MFHLNFSEDLFFSFIELYNEHLMDDKVAKKIKDFFSEYKKQTFKKGELLIKAEETPAGVFYLEEGIVKMYAIGNNGDELVINTFKQGAFFPMAWILNDKISHHYYEAQTNVTVWVAPKEDFLIFLKSESDVVLNLVKRIYSGLDGYFMRMEYLLSGGAKNRLITELLIYAKRFGEINDNKAVVKLKLTENDLASQTGTARETVSRELQKLKDQKLINIESKTLTIYDIKKLEAELIN